MRQVFSALSGDHALRPELLPDIGVISFAVELGDSGEDPKHKFSVRRTRAEHDSEAIHHQRKSFSGTESGTGLLKKGWRKRG
jgi:hypothetical protein